MSRTEPFALIDTLRKGSVSFAPPDPSEPEPLGLVSGGRPNGPVGAGRLVSTPALLGGASRDGVSGYPIQVGKVQRPPLREETLARHRLLDWLDVKIHNRVVFVIADAGYGKTTLLADFSRRTRLRTLWYRMDEEDRSWVTFLSYLVAAGREHDPAFAPRTFALLQNTDPGGATRDEVVAMFLRELPDIAPTPTVLILDDFHAADGSGDVSYVAKSLVHNAPERVSIVISSRRTPEIPVGRLRAQGELAELRTRDLQFSEIEIADLFKANDGQPLDRESLGLLNERSEGWAASLQLVRTAVRDRTQAEVRAFIKGLSGEQAELYDYLAEEVVGDLRPAHQEFLMRTSILQSVSVTAAAAITADSEVQASTLVDISERLGLLSRQGSAPVGYRYHPLVRQFLEARLRAGAGDEGVKRLHRLAGSWAEQSDWRTACYHFEAAGEIPDIHRVIDSSIDKIAGQGGYELASVYLHRYRPAGATAAFEIIESRIDFRHGRLDSALQRAEHAVTLDPETDVAVNNYMTILTNVGDHAASWTLAKRMAESATSPIYKTIARASCLRYEASIDGSLSELVEVLRELAMHTEADDLSHFAGVSHLNLSLAEHEMGDSAAAYADADRAILGLAAAHKGDELASAFLARAQASARSGRLTEARTDITAAGDAVPSSSRGEWLIEVADIEVASGSAETAAGLLEEARHTAMTASLREFAKTIEARLALREGEYERAGELADGFELGKPAEILGLMTRQMAVRAHAAVSSLSPDAASRVKEAMRLAEKQGALSWIWYCQILAVLVAPDPGAGLSALVRRGSDAQLAVLDCFAEQVCSLLAEVDDETVLRITRHAERRRERWLSALRRQLADASSGSRWRAAEVLDEIGTVEDIPTLRALARSSRGSPLRSSIGRALARRLAPRFVIEDLGRVELASSGVALPSTPVRRKVLAMLCYLLTRPRFAATRDEVIDSLWPDLSPDVAVNSLNQTVYFLRRVFEPTYKEDTSAGYVHHNSDVLWLDLELVSSRSSRCLAILDALGSELSPEHVGRLSQEYTDRFALDFAYEEWAVPFRTSLHVAYLQVVEAAVTRDMGSGHDDRAIELARRALDVDGTVESLELALVRLYRTTGAHAAAAEQYAHYATVLREEFGVEPPPLDSL